MVARSGVKEQGEKFRGALLPVHLEDDVPCCIWKMLPQSMARRLETLQCSFEIQDFMRWSEDPDVSTACSARERKEKVEDG